MKAKLLAKLALRRAPIHVIMDATLSTDMDQVALAPAVVQLPEDFEAKLCSLEERKTTVKGMVVRQQLVRLAMKGLDATRAAKLVGVSPWTARAVYREPGFRKEVYSRVDGAFTDVDKAFAETKKSLHERLAEKAEDAFNELCGLLEDPGTLPSIKVKIAQDFLDRNPETQAGHTVTRMNPALQSEQLAAAAHSAREMDAKVTPISRRSA